MFPDDDKYKYDDRPDHHRWEFWSAVVTLTLIGVQGVALVLLVREFPL